MRAIGFPIRDADVLGADVYRQADVYPLQLVDTADSLATCREFARSLGTRVQSVGRQGAFQYVDMDQAIEMGWSAARALVDGTGKVPADLDLGSTFLWDPQRRLAGLESATAKKGAASAHTPPG
jgi:hypothetical protein